MGVSAWHEFDTSAEREHQEVASLRSDPGRVEPAAGAVERGKSPAKQCRWLLKTGRTGGETLPGNGLSAYSSDPMPGSQHYFGNQGMRHARKWGCSRQANRLVGSQDHAALFVGVLVIYAAVLRGKVEVYDDVGVCCTTENDARPSECRPRRFSGVIEELE
jgi:hypothetical protein